MPFLPSKPAWFLILSNPNSETTTYTYDAHDKLQTAGSKSYGYDNNGNCTTVTLGGQTTSLRGSVLC